MSENLTSEEMAKKMLNEYFKYPKKMHGTPFNEFQAKECCSLYCDKMIRYYTEVKHIINAANLIFEKAEKS